MDWPSPTVVEDCPSAQRSDIRRAALALGEWSDCQRRQRTSRSGSFPPRPRSVSRAAASAAAFPKPRTFASISMWASLGSSGIAAMARPCWVIRPSGSIAPRRDRRVRASARAAAGGGSRKGRRVGSDSPHNRQVSNRLERSASMISGGSWAGSEAVAASSHKRIATPAAWRAARPARCVTAARLARSVTSRVRPAPRS